VYDGVPKSYIEEILNDNDLLFRAVGRSENPGVLVVFRWA
jgi:hypothetical protein